MMQKMSDKPKNVNKIAELIKLEIDALVRVKKF